MSDKSHVGMTQCYFCGGDSQVVLHKQLRPVLDRKMGVLDMTPCGECATMMQDGVIIITVRDGEMQKVEQERQQYVQRKHAGGRTFSETFIPNPYRTGGFFCAKESFFEGMDKQVAEFALKKRWIFMEHSAAVQIGFPLPENPDETS